MKKRHLIAAGIVVAVVAMPVPLWVNEGILWRWVMTKGIQFSEFDGRSFIESEYGGYELRGWVTVERWNPTQTLRGTVVLYYQENGFKAAEGKASPIGPYSAGTRWGIDGRLKEQQIWKGGERIEHRGDPPWLWGVTDQAEPTAPWWGKETR